MMHYSNPVIVNPKNLRVNKNERIVPVKDCLPLLFLSNVLAPIKVL